MATSDKLQVIATKLQESYTAAQSKGATMPAHQGINQLPACIESIQTTSVTPIVTDAFKSQDVLAAMQSMYDPAYPHMIGYMLDTTATSITLPYSCDKLIKSDAPDTPIYDANGTYAFGTVPGAIYKFVILCFTTAHKTQKLIAIGSSTELICTAVHEMNVNGIGPFTGYNRMHTLLFSTGCQLVGNIDDNAFNGNSVMMYYATLPQNTGTITIGNFTFNNVSNLKKISIPAAKVLNGQCFNGCSNLLEAYLPNVDTWILNYGGCFKNCTALEKATFGKVTSFNISALTGFFAGCPNINNIIFGAGVDINLDIASWNPTNVLADSTKKAQMVANIKTGIADMMKDNTGLTARTITFTSGIREAIRGSAAESTLVAKNWNISPA
jgi:hypothetical protein